MKQILFLTSALLSVSFNAFSQAKSSDTSSDPTTIDYPVATYSSDDSLRLGIMPPTVLFYESFNKSQGLQPLTNYIYSKCKDKIISKSDSLKSFDNPKVVRPKNCFWGDGCIALGYSGSGVSGTYAAAKAPLSDERLIKVQARVGSSNTKQSFKINYYRDYADVNTSTSFYIANDWTTVSVVKLMPPIINAPKRSDRSDAFVELQSFGGATMYLDDVQILDLNTLCINVKDGYATLGAEPRSLIVPEGVVASTYYVEDGVLVRSKVYNPGDIIPAGECVVIHTQTDGNYFFMESSKTGEKDANNMLKAWDESVTPSEKLATAGHYYVLSHDAASNNMGFYYYDAAGSGNFTLKKHRACLFVPNSKTNKTEMRPSLAFGDVVTSVDLAAEKQKQKLHTTFNVKGQRVSDQTKGIVIQDGKLIFKR